MSVLLRGTRRGRVLVLVASAVSGVVLLAGGPGGPPPGGAADRYRAGEPSAVRSVVPAEATGAVRARGLALARALGVPAGVDAELTRVVDRFSGTTQDEVVTTDARGRRLGIVRMDGDGRVTLAVRLGWSAPGGRRIDATSARTRASALATGAGLPVDGTPTVAPDTDGGWRVTWDRTVDGVPATGDGTAVNLFEDGSFHAAAHRERPLATPPSERLSGAAAEVTANERLASLLGPSRDQARIVRSRLAWVAPNDTFDASRPDAPDPMLRLAWVVEVRTLAPLSDSLRALELYLDAGDGTLLGGDLLR